MAVADFATGDTSVALDLAGGKAGEIVVEQETAGAFDNGAVDGLLVELGA